MDPITGISLASSSVQLADFMFRIISRTCSIYKSASGVSGEYESLANIASRLRDLTKNVSNPQRVALGRIDQDIIDTAKSCTDIADQLLEAVERLNRGDKTVWRSLRAALKTVWNKDRVQALYESLCRLQWTLITQLQFSIT